MLFGQSLEIHCNLFIILHSFIHPYKKYQEPITCQVPYKELGFYNLVGDQRSSWQLLYRAHIGRGVLRAFGHKMA